MAKKTGELKAAGRRNTRPWVLKVFGVIGFVAIGFGANEGWNWATSTSPRFALTREREGPVKATDVELVRLGGVLLGQNLFAMDTAAMERAIAAHPVDQVGQGHRSCPSRLSIDVEERARSLSPLARRAVPRERERVNPSSASRRSDRFRSAARHPGIDRDAFASKGRGPRLKHPRRARRLRDRSPRRTSRSRSERSDPEGDGLTVAGLEIEFGDEGTSPPSWRPPGLQELVHPLDGRRVIHLDNRARPSWVP